MNGSDTCWLLPHSVARFTIVGDGWSPRTWMLQGNPKVSRGGRSAVIAPASGRRALLNTPFRNVIRTPVTKSFVPRSPSWNSPSGCNRANAFRAPYQAFTASSTNSAVTRPPNFAPIRRFTVLSIEPGRSRGLDHSYTGDWAPVDAELITAQRHRATSVASVSGRESRM